MQKSRIQWLKEGDDNTSFFFKCINGKRNINQISKLSRMDGNEVDDQKCIKKELVNYFSNCFNEEGQHGSLDGIGEVISNKILQELAKLFKEDVSKDEIEKTFISLPNNKALSLEGFRALFFKKA